MEHGGKEYPLHDASMFQSYKHHGAIVHVNKDLKGKHREHCLCYSCASFRPGTPECNCHISNMVYAICIALDVVTPVFECPLFVHGEPCWDDIKTDES